MKKFVRSLLLCIVALKAVVPTIAYADVGPKPSVVVAFRGLQDNCYVTLLSKTESTGPYSAYAEGTKKSGLS
jgi:hypothetical protein